MGEKQTYSQSEQKRRERRLLLALSFGTLAAALVIWQLLVSAGIVSSRFLPAPTAIVNTFFEKIHSPNPEGATLQMNLLSSLRVALIGFVMAVVIGIPLGLFMGWYEPVDRLVRPVFEVIRPIPPIAWIPLITIWFGIGEFPKILIVFIGTFANVVVNTATGVRMVDAQQLDVGKTFGASQFNTLLHIVLPASLPAIFAGIRTALGAGWAVVLAAEMLGATSGVGFLITRGNEIGDTALILVSMFIIGIIGALLSSVTSWIERKACPWRTN